MNWANRLTILRIVLVPVFVLAILYHRLDIALGIFILAAITDGLDGYIARSRNEITTLGKTMDPIADKLLIVSAYLSFSLVRGLPEYLNMPIYVPLIVISRDVIILLGAMIIHLIRGSVTIRPTVLGKITTFFQLLTIILMLMRFIHSSWLWNITVVLSILSGLDYIRLGARQVQINENS